MPTPSDDIELILHESFTPFNASDLAAMSSLVTKDCTANVQAQTTKTCPRKLHEAEAVWRNLVCSCSRLSESLAEDANMLMQL